MLIILGVLMKIAIFGDWHANTEFALSMIEKNKEADTFLHVGDFGVWADSIYDDYGFVNQLNNELRKLNKELWFIDGNHEDFSILESLRKNTRGLGILASNILHIPRGHTWSWDNIRFIGVGGAVSVDRNYRTLGYDYFKEEMITKDDLDKTLNAETVDIMISHDAPILPVTPKFFSESINRDADENIKKISEITAKLEPKLLVHGHYHHPYYRRFLNTDVVGLDCDQGTFEDNVLIIDTYQFIDYHFSMI